MAKAMKEGRYAWDTDEIELTPRLVFGMKEKVLLQILDKQVTVSYSHYIQVGDRNKVIRCKRLDGQECDECKKGDTPQPRFGCVTLIYRAFQPLEWELKPWLFGKDKFRVLRDMKRSGVDFLKQDLQIYCFNEKFQNVKIEPRKDAILMRPAMKAFRDQVVKAYNEDRPNIMKFLTGEASDDVEVRPPVAVAAPAKPTVPAALESASPWDETPTGMEEPAIAAAPPVGKQPAAVSPAPAGGAVRSTEDELQAELDDILAG